MDDPILKIDALELAYDKKSIIRNCSFELNKGESLVILGASGAGKSTLLKAIAGLVPHQKGSITFEKKIVVDAHKQLIPGHDTIKLINQDFGLDDYHTVEENIRLKLIAYTKDYQLERIDKMLRLTALSKFKSHQAINLSGGQKQRLAMARTLSDEPHLVLLDEPFNQVDFKTKIRLTAHLRAYLKKSKTTMIMVTHNGEEAMEWGTKIGLLEKGKITRICESKAFYLKPKSVNEAQFFGHINKVLVANSPIYFRPHNFNLKPTKNSPVKLIFEKTEDRFLGSFYRNKGKVGDKRVFIDTQTKLEKVSTVIYVKNLFSNCE